MAAKSSPAAQKLLVDRALLRAINLQRFSNAEARGALRVLAEADASLSARLAAALERLSPESFTVRRLDELLRGVWEWNDAVYNSMALRTARQMRELAGAELEWRERDFLVILREGVKLGVPPLGQVQAAAAARPFRGRLLSDWFDTLSAQRQGRVEVAVRTGYVQGLTVDEIVRSVRGTRAQGYKDGILAIDHRNAEAVVRTAVQHTAAVAREKFFEANADILVEEEWVSTLDSRTTDLCMVRDGKRYTVVDHAPVGHDLPWLDGPGEIHWNCRSTAVPVIDPAVLGLKLPPLPRAAVGGPVAATTKYGAWLAAQPASVQDEVLGKTRAADFRAGRVKFEAFFNDKGRLKTLAELRAPP